MCGSYSLKMLAKLLLHEVRGDVGSESEAGGRVLTGCLEASNTCVRARACNVCEHCVCVRACNVCEHVCVCACMQSK